VADLLRCRGEVLDSILQKRLARLAELAAPIAKLEGVGVIELQNKAHISTKLRAVRDLQFEAANKMRQGLENLQLASQARPGCNVYAPDQPIPYEREYTELLSGESRRS
jgi:hypothetical protein